MLIITTVIITIPVYGGNIPTTERFNTPQPVSKNAMSRTTTNADQTNRQVQVNIADVKEAAFEQFRDGSGRSHHMELVEDDGVLYLVYNGGAFSPSDYENPHISGYEVVEHISFSSRIARQMDDPRREECLQDFGGIKDELTLNGETYDLNPTYW